MRGIINTYTNNMSYRGYEKFYVNGCSHSQGGGLEGPELKEDSVFHLYKEKYGIKKWGDRNELNFGARLSKSIGIPFVNEAESGGGVERVVRMAYEWIWDNWEIKDRIFLILENPDPSRFEVYYRPLNQYFIVNSNLDAEIDKAEFVSATRRYYGDSEQNNEDKRLEPIFMKWFSNHANVKENWKRVERDFVGLYSFCKMNGIKIFPMTGNSVTFRDCFDKDDIVKFGNDEKNYEICSWAFNNGKTIKDELDGKSPDGHPGYFGHIQYAELLKEFLDKKL